MGGVTEGLGLVSVVYAVVFANRCFSSMSSSCMLILAISSRTSGAFPFLRVFTSRNGLPEEN